MEWDGRTDVDVPPLMMIAFGLLATAGPEQINAAMEYVDEEGRRMLVDAAKRLIEADMRVRAIDAALAEKEEEHGGD